MAPGRSFMKLRDKEDPCIDTCINAKKILKTGRQDNFLCVI